MDGCVVRQKKAYPVYDDDYAQHVATIREELEERYPNLHLVGRNGMHKYNNQDHAMMTAMLCVENILADTKLYDLWQVNGDAEYHEAGAVPEEEQGTACVLSHARRHRAELAPKLSNYSADSVSMARQIASHLPWYVGTRTHRGRVQ